MPRSLDFITEELLRVAEDLGVDPRSPSFTRTAFLKHTTVTKHDLDAYGGFAKLKYNASLAEEEPLREKVEPVSRGIEIANNLNRNLERIANTRDYYGDKLAKTLTKVFEQNPLKLKSPKSSKPSSKKTDHNNKLTLLWSDLHFGVDVRGYEVLNNEYTWTIASRRLAYLCKYAVDTCEDPANTDLTVILNGDIIHGVIHLDDVNIRPLTEQIWCATQILLYALEYLSTHFRTIDVVGVAGNHDRATYKASNRELSQRWDSHTHAIFLALKLALREEQSITWNFPSSGIAFLDDLNGGYLMVTHGDASPDVGNVSKKIDTTGLKAKLLSIKDTHAIDKPISVALFGHWHTPTVQMLPNGSFVIVNGCLIGTDPYGQNAIGAFNSVPAQIQFYSKVGQPCHNVSVVRVREADNDTALDDIISTPTLIVDGKLHC